MQITRPLAAGIAAGILFATGCTTQTKDTRADTTVSPGMPRVVEDGAHLPESPGEARTADVGPPPGAAGMPDLLTRRVEAYSREVESLIGQGGDRASAARPAAAATATAAAAAVEASVQPSQVRWIDVNEFRLGDVGPRNIQVAAVVEDANENPPAVAPAIENARRDAHEPVAVASLPLDGASITADVTSVAAAAANTPATEAEDADAPVPDASAPHAPDRAAPVSSAGELGGRLASRARDYPRDLSTQLEHQLLLLLLDEQVPHLSSLAALPTEDRELLTAVLDGLTLFRNTLRQDNNMLLSRKIKPLIDMADRLRSQAELTLPTVTLCRRVGGFGNYEPIDPARFAAGREHKAIVYCEIANFASNLNSKGLWQTQLKQDLVLYTEAGVPVWSDRTELIRDEARGRRHDFFVNKLITIPGNLTMGRYLLKVTIVDEQANRVAEASIPIVVAAQ